MDTFPDLGSLTDAELKDLIRELTDGRDRDLLRRRILHGKIDILRAELVNRLRTSTTAATAMITGEDVQQLTEILASRPSSSRARPPSGRDLRATAGWR